MKITLLVLSILAMILSAIGAQADSLNQFIWLDSENDALQARLDIVQQANTEITAEYFYLGEDSVAYTGLAALREAALRGVKVRVIVDLMMSKISKETLIAAVLDEDVSKNLEIKLFNRFTIRNPELLHLGNRDHTKVLIADKKYMVVGGRNISCQYFYLCNNETTFTDLDALVAGPIAAQAQTGNFDKLWNNEKALTPLKFERNKALTDQKVLAGLKNLDDSFAALEKGRFPIVRSHSGNVWLTKMKVINNAQFLHDDPNEDPTQIRTSSKKDIQWITPGLVNVIKKAQRTLTIQTPYLFPDAQTQALLNSLIHRRQNPVHVKILTNSLHSTDNLLVQAGYRSLREKLINMGIELYEFKGPRTAHAKTAVIDDHTIIIGSFNLDPRSANLNREVAVVGESDELAAELTRIIDEKFQQNALLIGINGQPIGTAADWDAGVDEQKMIKVDVLQKIFLRFIKGTI